MSPSESGQGPEQIQRSAHRDSSRREQVPHRAETQTGLCGAAAPTATEVPLRPPSLSTRCPQQLRNVGTPPARFWPGASRKVGLHCTLGGLLPSLTQGLRKRLNMQKEKTKLFHSFSGNSPHALPALWCIKSIYTEVFIHYIITTTCKVSPVYILQIEHCQQTHEAPDVLLLTHMHVFIPHGFPDLGACSSRVPGMLRLRSRPLHGNNRYLKLSLCSISLSAGSVCTFSVPTVHSIASNGGESAQTLEYSIMCGHPIAQDFCRPLRAITMNSLLHISRV